MGFFQYVPFTTVLINLFGRPVLGIRDILVRIRIREAQKNADPVDPDPGPQHCGMRRDRTHIHGLEKVPRKLEISGTSKDILKTLYMIKRFKMGKRFNEGLLASQQL
jgi:hypothetical protein